MRASAVTAHPGQGDVGQILELRQRFGLGHAGGPAGHVDGVLGQARGQGQQGAEDRALDDLRSRPLARGLVEE